MCNKGGKYHNKLLTSSSKWHTAETVREMSKHTTDSIGENITRVVAVDQKCVTIVKI